MTEALSRLLWALPAVLALGVGIVLVLRRIAQPGARPEAAGRLRHLESLPLADGARLHLVELDRRALVLAETAHGMIQLRLPGDDGSGTRVAGLRPRGLFAGRAQP